MIIFSGIFWIVLMHRKKYSELLWGVEDLLVFFSDSIFFFSTLFNSSVSSLSEGCKELLKEGRKETKIPSKF